MIRQYGRGLNATVLQWSRTLLDLLFPPTCVGCGEPGVDWCDQCNQSLRILLKPLCTRCGSQLLDAHKKCVRCREFPGILTVRSYAIYEGSLLRALLHLKYRPNRQIARIMGHWLAELSRREGMEAEMIIPVPLGRVRFMQRGYNQVDLIVDSMAEYLGIPRNKKALKRVRETKSQVGLDPVARRLNVQNAFLADQQAIRNQIVYLVDDLFTTGSTFLACTHALQKAGVHKVYGLTVARA